MGKEHSELKFAPAQSSHAVPSAEVAMSGVTAVPESSWWLLCTHSKWANGPMVRIPN